MTLQADHLPRDVQRLDWARAAIARPALELQRASVDAGHRSYWRTHGEDPSRIVMDSPPGLEDVRPWLRMHELLDRGGVRVPQVLARDVELGFLLLEDLGTHTLAQVLDDGNADAHFDAAIGQLLRLQAIAPPQGMGAFDEALLQRDAGLFEEWFLRRHLGLQLDCDALETLELVQRRLMDNALVQPQVLTHRDFMPRNLMPVTPGPAVLDFQDCVRGPIAYDPVSLFKDAFHGWPPARVDGWLRHYHARASEADLPVPSLDTFLRDADWMGAQRHLKILGIFARLRHRDGKPHYLADAPRFIAYLDDVLPKYPELAPLHDVFQRTIKPALAGLSPASSLQPPDPRSLPMKALIFAAGRGERMRPLTDTTPKPLLHVGGKPLIAWHLEKLAAIGVRNVVINTSWLAEKFPEALGDGGQWGLRIHYSYEGETPLETGGGLLHALPLLGDAPFIAVNGDIRTDYDFARLPRDPAGLAHVVAIPLPAFRKPGAFEQALATLLPRADGGLYTLAGIAVYRPALLHGLAPGHYSIVPRLTQAIADGQLTAEAFSGRWHDVGTPQRLAQLQLAQFGDGGN